jgi:hypothetical protein
MEIMLKNIILGIGTIFPIGSLATDDASAFSSGHEAPAREPHERALTRATGLTTSTLEVVEVNPSQQGPRGHPISLPIRNRFGLPISAVRSPPRPCVLAVSKPKTDSSKSLVSAQKHAATCAVMLGDS